MTRYLGKNGLWLVGLVALSTAASAAQQGYWDRPKGATMQDWAKVKYTCLQETPYVWSYGEMIKDQEVLMACYAAHGWRFHPKEG